MASGDTLITIHPYANQPPTTIPATPDTRNTHPVLDFDAAADEEAVFSDIMPRNYAAGGVTVALHISMTTATSGNAVLQVAFERIGDGQQDVDSDGFASFKSTGQVAVPATSGNVKIATVAFANGAEMDSIAVGEKFRIKVRRDADDTSATDDATGDLELHGVEIRET